MRRFLVDMDDGSERSIQVDNTIDYDGDLILVSILSENLLTAVMDIRNRHYCSSCPRIILARLDYDYDAIILPVNDENNSILFMKAPRNASRYVQIDARLKLERILGHSFPLVFTHLTELEYTFF